MAVADIDKCYIFGAGIYGKTALLELERQGTKILGYLDNNEAKAGKIIFHGKACSLPGTLSEADRKLPVILANSKPEVRQVVRSDLERLGYTDIRDYGMDEIYVFWEKIPDEECLRLQWAVHMGEDYKLDLEKPRTFNEKIQWLKLYDRNPLYTQLVDKYAVKQWVAERVGEEHVIPTLGVWEHFDDIDFSKLPDKFVLKCTHDSGSVVFCRGQESFDKAKAKAKLEFCLSRNLFWLWREWPYLNVPPRIIAEPFMTDESGVELKDYKIQSFNGTPEFIQVDFNRFAEHKRNLYDVDWNYIEAEILYPTDSNRQIPRPTCLEKLLDCARELSKGIPYVRTDFYVINDAVYFGEMTFHHGAGYENIRPESFARQINGWLQMPLGGGHCTGKKI